MKITIITVCLNSEKAIEQTIQSVLKQKYKELEYIIVDGYSEDRTLEIINKYRNYISEIISEKDNGIYDAMNKGLRLATGDVIGIINSDDWYESDTFESVADCFQKTDAEIIYGNLNLVYENGKVETQIPDNLKKISYQMEIPHPTVFIKRRVYEKYGTFQLKYTIAADYELMLRFYIKGVRFFYLDKVLANFRLGGASIQQKKKCKEETIMISQSYLPLVDDEYYKNIIIHNSRAYYFSVMLDNYPEKLIYILSTRFQVNIMGKIAIFGVGKWGVKAYNALHYQKKEPIFFVDNNVEMWGKKINSIRVVQPDTLKCFKGTLLIVVKKFSAEILNQIGAMNNLNVHCITWEEIAEEYIQDKGEAK